MNNIIKHTVHGTRRATNRARVRAFTISGPALLSRVTVSESPYLNVEGVRIANQARRTISLVRRSVSVLDLPSRWILRLAFSLDICSVSSLDIQATRVFLTIISALIVFGDFPKTDGGTAYLAERCCLKDYCYILGQKQNRLINVGSLGGVRLRWL